MELLQRVELIHFSLTDPTIIKSVSYSQEEIIKWIMQLYCPEGIELDPTYSKGVFYKNISKPKLKFDIAPQLADVQYADCTCLPLKDGSVKSIMFDPPFVAAIPKIAPSGIITKRFGFYRNVQHELWSMYRKALKEFYRILVENGVLIVKSQDTIDSGKQYLSHVEIINYACLLGFYPKDLFILVAKNRIIGKTHHKQQHTRKFHSYFIVFLKQKNPVIYTYQLEKFQLEGTPVSIEKKEPLVERRAGGKYVCGYAGACTYRSEDGSCLFKRPCKDKRTHCVHYILGE